jgi:YgiT-type zinc finger domain-containing protein
MTCVMCGNGVLTAKLTTSFFDGEGKSLLIKNVPSLVCDQCGEVFHDDETTEVLLALADNALVQSAELIVEEYRAA